MDDEQDDLDAQRPLRDGSEAKQAAGAEAINIASGCPLRDAATADLDQHPLSFADEAAAGLARVQAHWRWCQRLWPGMTWRDWGDRQDGDSDESTILALTAE